MRYHDDDLKPWKVHERFASTYQNYRSSGFQFHGFDHDEEEWVWQGSDTGEFATGPASNIRYPDMKIIDLLPFEIGGQIIYTCQDEIDFITNKYGAQGRYAKTSKNTTIYNQV